MASGYFDIFQLQGVFLSKSLSIPKQVKIGTVTLINHNKVNEVILINQDAVGTVTLIDQYKTGDIEFVC